MQFISDLDSTATSYLALSLGMTGISLSYAVALMRAMRDRCLDLTRLCALIIPLPYALFLNTQVSSLRDANRKSSML